MVTSPPDPQEVAALRGLVDGFIQERLQLKLDKLKGDDDEVQAQRLSLQQAHVRETWLADAAKRVQREVLREGWHLRADRGVNILCYERKRSDRGSTRINGIVIREPQRFVQTLPAFDSMLVRVVEGARYTVGVALVATSKSLASRPSSMSLTQPPARRAL